MCSFWASCLICFDCRIRKKRDIFIKILIFLNLKKVLNLLGDSMNALDDGVEGITADMENFRKRNELAREVYDRLLLEIRDKTRSMTPVRNTPPEDIAPGVATYRDSSAHYMLDVSQEALDTALRLLPHFTVQDLEEKLLDGNEQQDASVAKDRICLARFTITPPHNDSTIGLVYGEIIPYNPPS